MVDKPPCKICSTPQEQSDDEISKAIERLSKLKGIRFVDDDSYVARLTHCSTCRYLEAGTTCLQCGCIVQIKAKIYDSTCPYPKDRKW